MIYGGSSLFSDLDVWKCRDKMKQVKYAVALTLGDKKGQGVQRQSGDGIHKGSPDGNCHTAELLQCKVHCHEPDPYDIL